MSTVNLNRGTWGVDPVTGQPWAWLRNTPLVSTARLATGVNRYSLCTTPYGDVTVNGYQMGSSDTNMSTDRVPASQKWYLFSAMLQILPPELYDPVEPQSAIYWDRMYRLLRASHIELTVEQQLLFQIPTKHFLGAPFRYMVTHQVEDQVPAYFGAFQDRFGTVEFRDRVNGYDGPYEGWAPYVLEADTSFRLDWVIDRDVAAVTDTLDLSRIRVLFDRNIVGLSAA